MHTPIISVFTPTYNRAAYLPQAYQSLLASTIQDIEWVIADDGSTDETAELVFQWQKQAPFPIRYFAFPHKGKMRTMNAGVQKCQGEFFFELDSDDELLPQGLEALLAQWRQLKDPEQYCSVVGRCLSPDGVQMGKPFPVDYNLWPAAKQHAWPHADACMALLRTSVMQQYPFPLPEGLNFVPEAVVWRKMQQKYREWYTNIPCYRYHRGADAGSYTAQTPDPRPTYFYYCYFFNEIYPHESAVSFREYGISAASLCYAALRCGHSLPKLWQDVHPLPAKVLCTLGWLPMAALYFFRQKEQKPTNEG